MPQGDEGCSFPLTAKGDRPACSTPEGAPVCPIHHEEKRPAAGIDPMRFGAGGGRAASGGPMRRGMGDAVPSAGGVRRVGQPEPAMRPLLVFLAHSSDRRPA